MKNKILHYIHRYQARLQSDQTPVFGRVLAVVGFFFFLLCYGVYTAIHLLFTPAHKGFSALHDQTHSGTWNGSYTNFQEFRRGVRLFSLTSFMTVITSVLTVIGVMQLIFPIAEISPVLAYDNTFTVSNTNDLGPGSLRKAITDANAASGSVEIVLSPVTLTITLASALPTLTHPVTFTNDSMAAVLRVDGQSLSAGTDCWELGAGSDGSTIVGLAFAYCPDDGLVVGDVSNMTIGGSTTSAKDRVYAYGAGDDGIEFGASNSTIQRTIVGYPAATVGGAPSSANGGEGILVTGDNNTITNVIAVDNGGAGIYLDSTASGNTISSSNIGVYTLGASNEYLGSNSGIKVYGDTNTVSSSTIQDNVTGLYIHDTADGTTVKTSYIGTDSASLSGEGNTDGIVSYGTNTTIGGTTAEKNIVSGNSRYGMHINGTVSGATGTVIKSNYVGTTVAGSAALANGRHGIYLNGVQTTTVGVAGNEDVVSVISGNSNSGLYILSSTGVSVYNTIIGESADQTTAIANAHTGITISSSSTVSIGSSSSTADANAIESNTRSGIQIADGTTVGIYGGSVSSNVEEGIVVGSSTGTTIQGVTINQNGSASVDNVSDSGVYAYDSTTTTITGNTISANELHGIEITDVESLTAGSGYTITSNTIGSSGSANKGYGLSVVGGATSTTIGGSTSAANTIAYNEDGGVYVSGSTTSGVKISKNTFTSNGGSAITLANSANASVAAPTLTGAGANSVQGTGGISGGSVEVYANGVYIAEDTSIDSSGAWSVGSTKAFSAYNGQSITAINITSGNNTSQFGAARELTTTAATLTATDEAIFTTSKDITATLSLDGTLYYTTDGTTPTTSSTSTTAPLSLTITETTTLKIFGVDLNGNITSTQSKTYTKESDADGGTGDSDGDGVTDNEDTDDDGDGVSDDEDQDADGDGEADAGNEQATLEATYLKPTNVTVAQQQIYEEALPVYVPFDDVRIAGKYANNDHQVNVIIKDKNAEIVDKEWVNVEEKKWKKNVSVTLEKGDEYTIHGKAREKNSHTTVSSVKKLATVIASNPAPALVNLTDRFTITAKTKNMLLTGLVQGFAEGATFTFQNQLSGAGVDTCTASVTDGTSTRSAACRLTNALSVGFYNVLFQTVETYKGNALDSAPAAAELIVTRPTATTIFNTDRRNTAFYNRITTSKEVTVIGLARTNTEIRLFIDGERIGDATVTGKITWQYTLDLSAYAKGKNYLLEVKFFDKRTGEELDASAISFPFRYAHAVTKPLIPEGVAATVVRNASLDVGVLGGADHTLIVSDNDTELYSTTIDQDPEGALANTTISLPTDVLGTHTITVQSEDATGLLSAASTYTYSVVAPTPVSTTPDTTTGTGTVKPGDATGGSTGGSTTPDDTDDDGVPNEWDEPVTTVTETEEIQERLNEDNTTTLEIVGQIEEYDTEGAVTTIRPADQNSIGETILHKDTEIGFADSILPWTRVKRSQEVIILKGQTDPYAIVTVTIHSDPIVQITRADGDGKWTMTVPVDAIPPGEHTAFIQTESKGVKSEQIEIAKFVVIEEKRISNTTWIFIINIGIALLVVFTAVVLQVRKRRKKLDQYTAPPVATIPLNVPVTPPKQEEPPKNDHDKPPDIHSALDV